MSEVKEAFEKLWKEFDPANLLGELLNVSRHMYREGFTAGIESVLERRCEGCGHFKDASLQTGIIKRRADWCGIGHNGNGNMRENFSCKHWEKKDEPIL